MRSVIRVVFGDPINVKTINYTLYLMYDIDIYFQSNGIGCNHNTTLPATGKSYGTVKTNVCVTYWKGLAFGLL